jgi:hypothetical protein
MAAAEQIVVRYPARRDVRAAIAFVLLVLVAMVVWSLVDAARHEREAPRIAWEGGRADLPPPPLEVPWTLRRWWLLALLAFEALMAAWILRRDILLTRRGLVRVTRAGLDVTNACGCPRHVDWS